jgi:invasion protein IalB
MTMFDSRYWVGYAAAAALIVITVAAIFFGAQYGRKQAGPVLPPIQAARIDPGFVGQHRFGLWTLICENVKAQAPLRVCRTNARMTVRGPNNAALLAAGFNIVMMKTQPAPGMLFRLPPAASAADSINFVIDQNSVFKAPLKCSQNECIAQGALPAEAIEQMRAGRTLSVIYTIKDRAQQDRKVRVDQLLHGFRESFDAMSRAISA